MKIKKIIKDENALGGVITGIGTLAGRTLIGQTGILALIGSGIDVIGMCWIFAESWVNTMRLTIAGK